MLTTDSPTDLTPAAGSNSVNCTVVNNSLTNVQLACSRLKTGSTVGAKNVLISLDGGITFFVVGKVNLQSIGGVIVINANINKAESPFAITSSQIENQSDINNTTKESPAALNNPQNSKIKTNADFSQNITQNSGELKHTNQTSNLEQSIQDNQSQPISTVRTGHTDLDKIGFLFIILGIGLLLANIGKQNDQKV